MRIKLNVLLSPSSQLIHSKPVQSSSNSVIAGWEVYKWSKRFTYSCTFLCSFSSNKYQSKDLSSLHSRSCANSCPINNNFFPGWPNINVYAVFKFSNLSSKYPGIFSNIEHFKWTTSSWDNTKIYRSLNAYVILNVILLWLYFLYKGSVFTYSKKSFIQPIFHLNSKPSPSSSAGFVTFGHAVDSSAITIAFGNCLEITEFKCLKNSIASRFSCPPYLFGTQHPGLFP